MQTNLAMPASRGVNKIANDVIALPGSFVFFGIAELLNKMCQQARVFFLPQQDAIRGQPVAPRPSRLLIILFDGFRQRKMDHRTHRRFVDPNPNATVPTSTGTSSDIHFS